MKLIIAAFAAISILTASSLLDFHATTKTSNKPPPSCYDCHRWIPQPDCIPTLGNACPPPG